MLGLILLPAKQQNYFLYNCKIFSKIKTGNPIILEISLKRSAGNIFGKI